MFGQKLGSRNYEFISQFYFRNSKMYGDYGTVTYTTISQMAASFTKLCEIEEGFLVVNGMIWVIQNRKI